MRLELLSTITATCVTAALAAQAPSIPTQKTGTTVTMTGCVTQGETAGAPFVLSGPTILPGATSTVGTTTTGSSGAQPTGTTGTPAPTAPVGASGPSAVPAPAPSAAIPAPAPSSAIPTATNAAPASPAPTPGVPSGFTLTGNDMTPWVGQRVQIVGMLVPPTGLGKPAAAAAQAAAGAHPTDMQEFRVQSVMPIAGGCAQ